MNITVFCGASSGCPPDWIQAAYTIGQMIGRRGHTLVFGGSNIGLMKEVCDGVLESGGKAIGVEPDTPWIRSLEHPGLTMTFCTDSISSRKQKMIELGDAFIALPGGLGTLDEITEITELVKLHYCSKPVVLFSPNHFYEPFRDLLSNMFTFGLTEWHIPDFLLISDDMEEIIRFTGI